MNDIEYHLTHTWPTVNAMKNKSASEYADFIDTVFIKGIMREIKTVMDTFSQCGGVGHVVLISLCSALDAIASYNLPESKQPTQEKGKQKKRFVAFIDNYFGKPKYDTTIAETIYNSLRCESTHEFNLHSCNISGIKNDPNHLKSTMTTNSNLVQTIFSISLYDFYDDISEVINNYKLKLGTDTNLQNNFIERYQIYKTIDSLKPCSTATMPVTGAIVGNV